jgi:hypothetical protein
MIDIASGSPSRTGPPWPKTRSSTSAASHRGDADRAARPPEAGAGDSLHAPAQARRPVLLSELETAASGLRRATRELEDARLDIEAAIAALGLAERSAIEALGESRGTARRGPDAGEEVAHAERRSRGRARRCERWQRQAAPLLLEIGRSADLYRSLPGVARSSPGIDPDGEYLRSLAETALENAATLASWKATSPRPGEAQAALRLLSDAGDEGLLAHFNRVPEVLQVALESR